MAAAWRWPAQNCTSPPPRLDWEISSVLWRQMPKGKGGQEGAQIAFSPDGQYLFLTVGDRQRFTPAQDPNQPEGKILRLTLDGKPAPGNPNFGKTGAATVPLIDPPSDTEAAKTATVVSTYTFPGPNLTPAETWASGVRTPYGMAFSPRRRIVGGRAWSARRRRTEPDRAGRRTTAGRSSPMARTTTGCPFPIPTRDPTWRSRCSIGYR